jgi:hypothetical protein
MELFDRSAGTVYQVPSDDFPSSDPETFRTPQLGVHSPTPSRIYHIATYLGKIRESPHPFRPLCSLPMLRSLAPVCAAAQVEGQEIVHPARRYRGGGYICATVAFVTGKSRIAPDFLQNPHGIFSYSARFKKMVWSNPQFVVVISIPSQKRAAQVQLWSLRDEVLLKPSGFPVVAHSTNCQNHNKQGLSV